MQKKYNILAALMFWTPLFFLFGWLLVLKHIFFVVLLISWAFICIGIATWIAERTFDRRQ